jgi:hypothetical protein
VAIKTQQLHCKKQQMIQCVAEQVSSAIEHPAKSGFPTGSRLSGSLVLSKLPQTPLFPGQSSKLPLSSASRSQQERAYLFSNVGDTDGMAAGSGESLTIMLLRLISRLNTSSRYKSGIDGD